MNTKAKGTAFERFVVNHYRKRGIFAMRAPASLGIDVVVYLKGVLYGLECTTQQYILKKKVRKLLKACKKWGIEPLYCIKNVGERTFRLISEGRIKDKLESRNE